MKSPSLSIPRRALAGLMLVVFTATAPANPAGMTVQNGSAILSVNGSQVSVTAANNALLNWQSFNIGAGESVGFIQPSASSIVWNRVNDANPSQIFGSLHANGIVVLLNASGFYFGPNAFVSAAGLVVSTANCAPPQNGGGGWVFNGPPPLASIVNYGSLKVGQGGSVFLIADKVENHGNIEAPGGSVGLAAGQTVMLSERPDGRGMSMNVLLPQGSVDNQGHIVADAGTIALSAKVVNQNGFLQANSVQNQNGVIELVASESVALGANSQILAQGDNSASGSAGGTVTLKAGDTFSDEAGSRIVTAGGANGGNGGNVEVSAPNVASLNSAMDARARPGFNGGEFLLDPANIVLGLSGSDAPDSSGGIAYDSGSGTLNLDVNSAFANKNFSSIKLQATGNITLAQNTVWDLSGSTGMSSGQLALQAGGDLLFNQGSLITDANSWSVSLMAGVSFPSGTVQSGQGNIYLNGGNGKTLNGAIQLAQGTVNLTAGNSILVGGGYVRTIGGGAILVDALAGSVNTGTGAAGYRFLAANSAGDPMYVVDANLGGISTANGGDVTIVAGQNVTAFLPTGTRPAGDAGSGAFGSAPGNVSITAGGNVTGHYVVANGTGSINAGNNAGTASAQLALSLINGCWNVTAGNNIVLQEVRNPNGVLNNFGFGSSPSRHYFNYAPGDFVSLTAGNGIQLTGASLPRNSGSFEAGILAIYPGILDLVAGAGGVTLGSDVMLFPSAQGSLHITTTGNGGLIGSAPGGSARLTLSDSDSLQYTSSSSFTRHAPVPVHLNNPTEVTLNISGDMNNILFTANEAAQITVGGNMNNSRFTGQNLHTTDVTRITVAGDILNRNEFTSIHLASAPDFGLLNLAYPYTDFYSTLISQLHYDPVTGTLTFQGRMTSDQLAALTSLTILPLDAYGYMQVDAAGNPSTRTVSILDTATATALFNATQDIPLGPTTGYSIGGGGSFNISARNLDLGTTLGIQSVGPLNNQVLAKYMNHGADINVSLSGNLDMFSTTICSLNGGAINVNAGGSLNVGSSTFSGNDRVARGIFSVEKSDVTVIAGGDINVNGSRIAAYDGGNVTVESLNGNVNAGTGGQGSVAVQKIVVDGLADTSTGLPYHSDAETIPGSGILATSFPRSSNPSFPASLNTVGNILVEAPNGNISASAGGIVELPLNSASSAEAVVAVLAGYELRDALGQRVDAAHLADGTPVLVTDHLNIDASGSGIIGSTVKLQASGNINGVIFARENIDLNAQQNVNVTALAQGTVSASAGGSVSGTIIGVGGINASGGSVDASLESNNAISGETSGSKGISQGTAANATASASSASDQPGKAENQSVETGLDDALKKKGKAIVLAQKTSRVTVLLPPKN